MYKAHYKKHILKFINPAGTSRGVLLTKPSWYIFLSDDRNLKKTGIGECSIIPNLSIDDRPDLENKIAEVCSNIHDIDYWLNDGLVEFPSIKFALETALIDLKNGGKRFLFPSDFTRKNKGIDINGLIWMGDTSFMFSQIDEKIGKGFSCIKMKIGALDFHHELDIIKEVRKNFSPDKIELRVDANGAFLPEEALNKLNILSKYGIHSIEQPIKAGQINEMQELCKNSPIPIALDEELIGIYQTKRMKELLHAINPQYIIIKPSLLGGFSSSQQWIDIAESLSISWWVTSALESNIGLNAIAQWTWQTKNNMPHGLGTGQLFSNNIDSPLYINKGKLYFERDAKWDYSKIQHLG